MSIEQAFSASELHASLATPEGRRLGEMRFTIEQRHLTDGTGRPIRDPRLVYHAFDAESVDEAVRLFVKKENAEIIGSILTFPGFQAVVTVRGSDGVFTLQVSPASGKFVVT